MIANISIHELLKARKNPEIWSVSPKDNVYKALQLMADKNIGALLVVEEGRLVGVFSERDYARKIILKGKCSLDTSVSDVMTTHPYLIGPDYTVEECLVLMNDHHIRHLPVVEKGKAIGMISMRDLVDAVIDRQESRIETLENYIEGHEYGK